ncbi:MAG: signal peptidase II [Myxococcota bacterium]
MRQKYILFTVVTALMVLIDQVTKIWVVNNIRYSVESIDMIPGFLSIVHAQNRGAAFGIMQGQMWIFLVFTLVAMGVLGQMLWQLEAEERFQNVALAMIASGAIGNAIDRVHKQSVTDFIRVYTDNPQVSEWLITNFGTSEWPSFNIADAAIVIGIVMFLIHFLFLERDQDVEPEPPQQPLEEPS